MSHRAKLILGPLCLLQLAFFSFIALHRFVDADEGLYLLASRLVLLHKTPYLDFFYNQAPLLPYVYAAWMKCAGATWVSAKTFAALLTSLLGTLLYIDVCRRTQRLPAALLAVFIFASSTLVFAWYPIAKTYSLSGLFLFAAYVAVSWKPATSGRWRFAAGGLCLGLATDTRSYLLLLLPLFVWWIVRESQVGDSRTLSSWFLAGFAVGVLPSAILFLASPTAFLFNNLGYHAIRSSEGLVGWWWEKFVIVLELFLYGGEGNGFQWSILFFVGFGLAAQRAGQRASSRFALLIAVVLGLTCLLPTPAYVQYFCLCVPFLVVATVCALSDVFDRLSPGREKIAAITGCAILLIAYGTACANDMRRYLQTGQGVPGVRVAPDKADWTLPRILEASEAIDRIAAPGESVASFWPGDIFQTHAVPVSGFENPFALPISGRLTAEQRTRYHILAEPEVIDGFKHHRWRIVVLRNQIISPTTDQRTNNVWDNGDSFRRSLLDNGYRLDHSLGGISIYVCCEKNAGD